MMPNVSMCESCAELMSRALHVLDLAMLPATGYNADHSDLCTHREAYLLDSFGHAEGTTSCHTLHVQRRQWKCLRTK